MKLTKQQKEREAINKAFDIAIKKLAKEGLEANEKGKICTTLLKDAVSKGGTFSIETAKIASKLITA